MPMVLAFLKKPYPLHYNEIFEEYARDNFLIKTMHLLAQDYNDTVYFSYVNSAVDDDLITATLGIDIIVDQIQKPVALLIHENQVFIIPPDIVSYYDFSWYIEGGYQEMEATLIPLARRIDMLRYVFKIVYRRLVDTYKKWMDEPRNYYIMK